SHLAQRAAPPQIPSHPSSVKDIPYGNTFDDAPISARRHSERSGRTQFARPAPTGRAATQSKNLSSTHHSATPHSKRDPSNLLSGSTNRRPGSPSSSRARKRRREEKARGTPLRMTALFCLATSHSALVTESLQRGTQQHGTNAERAIGRAAA